MPKINSVEDLQKIKANASDLTSARSGGKTRIIVGLGTCGIAAGGRAIMAALEKELQKQGLNEVTLETTGCIGMCEQEPLVDIIRPGEPRVTYGRMTPDAAVYLVSEHIINGNIVPSNVIGRAE